MARKVLLIILISLMMVASITAAIAGTEKEKVLENDNAGIFENKGLNTPVEDYVADEVIVKFKDGVERSEIDKINTKHGGKFRAKSHYSGSERIEIPKGRTVSEMVELYKKEAGVEYAEPNYIAHALMVPTDPYYKYQWNLKAAGINAEPAWDISTGSGVIVAIIDTGIKKGTDLANTKFVGGYDFINNDNDPTDDNGHGTHVAGTVAQSTNNGIGVAGIAYNSELMAVKVLDGSGSGTYLQVADGIRWASDHGANVISMSLGGGSPSSTLCGAADYAYSMGVTVVAAAGNDGMNSISYPAACNNVISVGATRFDRTLAYYSNYGTNLDLVAPGGDVNVDQNNDGYGDGILQQTFQGSVWGYYFFQGTSMATPHVSGVAALLKSKNSQLTPLQIEDALKNTAVDLGATGRDDVYGWGLINAEAALNYVSVPVILNHPPVANEQTITTNEDTPVNIVLTAIDEDNDPITFSIVSGPLHGVLTGTALTLVYTPNLNYNGPDSFTFKANDGKADSNVTKVSVSISPLNDKPVANARSVITTVNTPTSIVLTGSDADGDLLNYTVLNVPYHGILTGTAPYITYQPDLNYIGLDNFTFITNDGTIDSDAATISIDVKPVATTVFSDSFETGIITKWVQDSQKDWYDSNQRATEGTRSAEVDGSARDAYITIANPIDLSGRTEATINFNWLIESSLDTGEYLCLDLYNGVSWKENRCLKGNVDTENTWHHEEIGLSTGYLVNGFKLRFRAKMSGSDEDANVDNVSVVVR
ncbi:MAG: S8 family serine peptidase [Candidatus Methanoperedens sp.]|nr:S8 family serine peptidase [Candidatus Methanoperedens sp.]